MGLLQSELEKGKIDFDSFSKTIDIEELQYIRQQEATYGLKPTKVGPDGVFLKRNETDLMNNFSIDSVCHSYLDTSNSLKTDESILNSKRMVELEEEINKQSQEWCTNSMIVFDAETTKFLRFAMIQIYR